METFQLVLTAEHGLFGRRVDFRHFRPISALRAHMGAAAGARADGAIRRIGPSQATGACTGAGSGARTSSHVRWIRPIRIASNGV